MLKYDEIIKRMSDSEKIQILCDIRRLSDKAYRAKGIPEIKTQSMESLGKGEFPCASALANTWDLATIRDVANALSARAAEREIDLLTVPAPRVRINPYRTELSEDPLLASSIAKEYLNAATRANVSAGFGGFGLHADEAEFLDRKPDERFLREFIVKPYEDTLSAEPCAAVTVLRDIREEHYGEVNEALFRLAQKSERFGGAVAVGAHVSPEATVSAIVNGKLFFDGSALAAEMALSRYKKLDKAIRQGQESEQTLAQEIARGRALSPALLDEATDRLLDFVFTVKREQMLPEAPSTEEVASRAVRESVVLLKNNAKRLPLRRRCKKIALIGDAGFAERGGESCADACERLLGEKGIRVIGKERGYEWNKTRNEDMIDPAVALAKSADAVVLFLGIGEMRAQKTRLTKRLSLPANQKALLDRLGEYRKKIVAVLPSDEPWDLELSEHCAAILTLPMNTPYSAEALVKTLTGEWNPGGKLASSIYRNTDELYADARNRKHRDDMGTGVFLGYRRYITTGEQLGFPFGHGLSYTKFSYTKMKIRKGIVTVTVKNTGFREGVETVQLYAHKTDSSVLRPERELIGFGRIRLKPGRRGKVRIPLALPRVYARETGDYVTESGKYELLAGASLTDIRLKHRVTVKNGAALASDGKHLCDYIHTKSNIMTHNYKLEAKVKYMKRTVFNWIACFASAALAVILKLYGVYTGTENEFFIGMELFLCGLAVWIIFGEMVHRSGIRRLEKELLDRENERLFENAEQMDQYDALSMFAREFTDEDGTLPDETPVGSHDVSNEHFASIDRDRTFENAADDFEIFAAERGCKFRADSVRRLFAGLTSSRLIVLHGMESDDFKTLMHLLSDYFETEFCIDGVDASCSDAESLLFRTDAQGNKIKTNAMRAIEAARNAPDGIQLAGLSEVRCDTLEDCFGAYMNYIRHPLSDVSVRVVNDMNVESFHAIPRNVWFVLNLAQGETPDLLPAEIAVEAVTDMPVFDLCPESDMHTSIERFGYFQMDYLKERLAQAPDEVFWRRIDRLEESVSRTASFGIDNKLWIGLENFAYAYMACGGGEAEAVDHATAARLIVPMMLAWCEAGADCRDFELLTDNVFGEENGEACKKLIKACIEGESRPSTDEDATEGGAVSEEAVSSEEAAFPENASSTEEAEADLQADSD